MKTYYITDEQFDLMTEEQLDALNWEYYIARLEYERTAELIAEREAMESDYQYCK